MRKLILLFFFAQIVIGASLLFFVTPSLASSCQCFSLNQFSPRYKTPSCFPIPVADTDNSTCLNGKYAGGPLVSRCNFCTDNECKIGCSPASALLQISKSCTKSDDCQVQPCQNGYGECRGGACYVNTALKQCWDNTDSFLGQKIEFKAPVLEIRIPGVDFDSKPLTVDTKGFLTVPYLVEYIKAIYKFLAIAASIVAAIVIIMGGFQITMSAGGEAKGEGIKRVGQAITGLFIMWSSYAILYTINPALTQLQPIKVQYITPEGIELANPIEFTKATGATLKPKNTYKTQAISIANTAGLSDQCIVQTILAIESSGNANAIGHDENYTGSSTISSRRTFLLSGVKYSGNKFTPTKQSTSDYIPAEDNADTQKNDDSFIDNPPDYGLDWRFSHGFGLGQITLWDKNKCGVGRGYTDPFDNACYSIPDLLKPETALLLSVHRFQYALAAAKKINLAGEDLIQAAFYHYNRGKIDTVKMRTNIYSMNALETYQKCKANTNDINMDAVSVKTSQPDESDSPDN